MSWVSVEDIPTQFGEETRVLILLKENNTIWFPRSYEERIDKAWWIPQREAFAFEDVENAKHLISHWQPLPKPPKVT